LLIDLFCLINPAQLPILTDSPIKGGQQTWQKWPLAACSLLQNRQGTAESTCNTQEEEGEGGGGGHGSQRSFSTALIEYSRDIPCSKMVGSNILDILELSVKSHD
jgi:hypothetical protein